MFVFAKSAKELLVTSGVAISCCLCVFLAVRAFTFGEWGLPFGFFFLLLVIGVLWGNKGGYLATRYIWNVLAFFLFVASLANPFAWSDAHAEGFWGIASSALLYASALCLAYCLSEHAKLRKLEGAHTWRSLPLPLTWILLVSGLGCGLGFWLSLP